MSRVQKIEALANDTSVIALSRQTKFLNSMIKSDPSAKIPYPKRVSEFSMASVDMHRKHLPAKLDYELFKSLDIEHHEAKRSVPFVSMLENGKDTVIFTAYSSRIDIRILQSDGDIKFVQTWPLADNEIITWFDTKRIQWHMRFSAGTSTGIVYVFEVISSNRVIFKNHSDQITSVKFHPLNDNDTILTISKDWSIRLFDIEEEVQLAIYQDPFNFWISGMHIAWHHKGHMFLSTCDRGGQDLIQFWYVPEHEYHHPFSELEEVSVEEEKERNSSHSSDSNDPWSLQEIHKPDCLSYFREYRNVTKTSILQIDFFGDAFLLAAENIVHMLTPYTETEFLEVKIILLGSNFLEFKIVEEYLYVNCRDKILIYDMFEIINSPNFEISTSKDEIIKDFVCELNQAERFTVFPTRSLIATYNSESQFCMYKLKDCKE